MPGLRLDHREAVPCFVAGLQCGWYPIYPFLLIRFLYLRQRGSGIRSNNPPRPIPQPLTHAPIPSNQDMVDGEIAALGGTDRLGQDR